MHREDVRSREWRRKERILLWQDPEEDQEAVALAAEASVGAEALAAADLAAAALAEDAVTEDLAPRTITDISTDITIITITARDFSSSAPGIITTAALAVALQEVALVVFWHIFLPRLLLLF